MNIFIGFDSAWAGNQPGAAAAIKEGPAGLQFVPPWVQDFGTAPQCFKTHSQGAALTVIAIDQPTIVMNATGYRPVERAVKRVICRLGGAVQPAYTNKEPLFGQSAPIWGYCKQLGFMQKPTLSKPQAGQYLIEVYPCLNIVGLFPAFYQRKNRRYITHDGEVARYNPTRATFKIADWEMLCNCISEYGATHQINGMSTWAAKQASVRNPHTNKPSKSHQDALDAVLCTIIAYAWAKRVHGHGMVIGDTATGYMVTVAHDDGLINELKNSALTETVALTHLW